MSTESTGEPRAAAARLYGAGQHREALKVASAGLRAHPKDAALWSLGAGAALALGLTADAEQFLLAALACSPDFAEAHYNLGVLNYERRAFAAAARCFARALALDPKNAQACNNLGAVLKELGRLAEAETALRHALLLDPKNAQACNNLALVLLAHRRFDEARQCFDRALELNPQFAEALLSRGRMSAEAGDAAAAIACFDAAIAARPDYAEAHQNRALVSRAEPGAPWIGRLEAAYGRRDRCAPQAAAALNFAMGKTREELGDYEAAFAAYAEGNRLRGAQQPFDESAEERWLAAATRAFTREVYAHAAAAPAPDSAARLPIFVVGMPRSGTSLIEQVLASHPQVLGAGELTTLGELVAALRAEVPAPADRPAWRARLRILGEEYRARVCSGAHPRRCVVDKMPGNYRYLGLLALMIPDARVISVRRDPLDTCLSCYATPFNDGHEYASDLSVLARQYLRYQRLMDHWTAVLPAGSILEVSYEALVADLEGETRRMLGYLGLPWHADCLEFHRTARAVRTASFVQVRQPLYTRSIARWKRFERQLAPLKQLLAPLTATAAGARAPVG
jgi:Flp pilus assembly protein TadD